MKKRVFALAACLLLVMVTTTQVAIARTPQALPILSFSGTTARGSVICQADGDLERISAKLTLYEGTFIFLEWIRNGYGACFRRMHCQKW